MNQSEWRDKFLSTLSKYKQVILNNSSNWSLPKYKINPETFFPNYNEMLLSHLNSHNSNTFLDKIDYSEYRLVTLIACLNTANEKYASYYSKELSQYPQSSSSQMLRVNNIIKRSFELTSFIYILDWLQKIYQKDRSLTSEKVEFTNIQKGFHPDLLNQKGTLNEVNRKQYDELMSNVNLQIRRGEYAKAQEIAEYKNQFFLSAILDGGLAQNDFSIDSDELFRSVDFDLFPPYMKNKEFIEIKNAIQQNTPLTDDVYGNQNWTLWLSSLYESSELCNTESSLQLNKMSCFLTGSAPLNKNYQEPIDDILYRNILLLFNSSLLEKYINDKAAIDYYYSTEGNVRKIIDSKNGKTIVDILSYIRNTEGFKELIAIDYSLELEFDLIQMHFLSHSPESRIDYFTLLTSFLSKITDFCIKSDQLSKVIINNYTEITQLQTDINFEANAKRKEDNLYLMKANYFKMMFAMLISFIGANGDLIYNDAKDNESIINSIFILYDEIISVYCYTLFQITIDPRLIVYLTSFMFHLPKSQEILAALANQLNDNQQYYQFFVDEIERHFASNREEMSTFLANKTSIFSFNGSIKSIDMVLDEKVMDKINHNGFYISDEDTNKINQLKMLFTEETINKEILIKYILVLAFNFLAVNKINEVFLIINDSFASNFSSEIDISSIDEYLKELEEFYTEPNYQITIQSMAIRSSIRLIYQIVHCFNLYADIIYETKKKFSGSSSLFNNNNLNEEVVSSSLESLNCLIQLLVTNRTMTNFFIEFFGEPAYEDVFKKIVNNWIYQTIKWIFELKTNDIFLQKNIVTEIDNSLYQMHNLTMFKDIMMLRYYILKQPFGIEDGLNMLEREELLYEFISQENKKEILKLLYKSTTKNSFYLKEVFDKKTTDALMKSIDDLDF